MLSYYRYKVDHGMMTIDQVPEPYQSQLLAEQAASVDTTTTV